MATWEAVRAELEQRFRVDAHGEELSVVVERSGRGAGREQLVLLTRYHAWKRPMIELRSAFGEVSHFETEGLLAENLKLPLGAIARHGRFLVLVHKACLADLSLEGVLFLLDRVGHIADALEARTGDDIY